MDCHRTLILSFLFLLLVLLCHDVTARYRRQTSRRNGRQSYAPKAPGPNMCKVQHVLGTNKKFFTHCISKYFKVICERPTYERWECCSGYIKQRGEAGCTGVKPLTNIMETADDLGLNEFQDHAEQAGLYVDLTEHGAFTVFAPTDQAIMDTSFSEQSRLSQAEGTLPPVLNYHIAPGRLNLTNFHQKNHQFVTLYNGMPLRVNKYAFGVATVNCARIVRPDEKATNGIIHVIDKVLNPLDVLGTLADRLRDDNRFTQFYMALLVSDMTKKLRATQGSFTVLAPTNQAFSKLPNDVLDRILSDADTAEKVIRRHVIRGVYCGDAIIVAVGLKTLSDERLLFRCKRDGLRINEAKVLHSDIVTRNGVIHGIDTVLIPDSVKSTYDILHDMRLDLFMALALEAGLNETLDDDNITIFSPTDKAISELPPGYLPALTKKPLELKKLVGHHVVKGRVDDDQIVGDSTISTVSKASAKIRVTVHRNGILLDKAALDPNTRQCRNALVRRVDKVLIPPETDIMGQLKKDPDLKQFVQMLVDTGVAEEILPHGSYTVFAPTNAAIDHLDQRQLTEVKKNPARLRKFVQRHIVRRTIMKCSIPEKGTYTIPSVQGDITKIILDWKTRMVINKHSHAISDDILTTNGMVYKIDHVIHCSCEYNMRTRRGRYIRDHRYRFHH